MVETVVSANTFLTMPGLGLLHRSMKATLPLGYQTVFRSIDRHHETLPITVKRFMNLPGGHSKAAVAEALAHASVPELDKQQIMGLSGGHFQHVL
jgi:zinc transport system ATP-binding protein